MSEAPRDEHTQGGLGGQYTRRDALKLAGGAALAMGLGGSILAACGGGTSTGESSASAAASSPVSGGTLRIGGSGGGAGDILDPHNFLSNTDILRLAQIYDPLVWVNPKGEAELLLAEEMTPNADATQWTIRIPAGVKCHDGKTLTGKDVLWNFQRVIKEKLPITAALGPIDINQSKVVDDRTVLIAYQKPFSILKEALSIPYFFIMPEGGYDSKTQKAVGTGPFQLKSFTPGESSETTKFADYWMTGKPYLDGVITQNINDEQSQVNALQSGQVDAIDYLSVTSIQSLQGSGMTLIKSNSAGWIPFTPPCTTAPFNDVNVRKALRLGCDRQQYLDLIYGGAGSLGNDIVFAKEGVPLFDPSIPQTSLDVEQAKSLLKQAGQENLSFELVSAPVAPAEVQIAQLFADQMKNIGVTVKIQSMTVTDFFANSWNKGKDFAQDWWWYAPYLAGASMGNLKNSPFNVCRWFDSEYDALWEQATATTDANKQADLAHQMMTIENERGGFIIPFFYPVTDATTANVHGLPPMVSGLAFNSGNLRDVWMTS